MKKTIDLIKEQNIEELIDYVEKSVVLNPVCIPSYKFRKSAKLVRNNRFSAKVFVFVYEDDFIESGYDSYGEYSGDIEFVKISKKDFEDNGLIWRGLSPKRTFIQRYMAKLGIKRYFMVDDDINWNVAYSYKQRNNACHSCQLKQMTLDTALKLLQYVGEEHPEYKQLGFPFTQLKSQFFNFQKEILDEAVSQVMYFNDMPVGIEFPNQLEISEDYDFFFTCRNNGIKTGVLPYVSIISDFSNTVCNNERIPLHDYIKHPDYIDLKVNIRNILISKINYVKIRNGNPKKTDEKLIELCKQENIEEVKSIVPHLKSKRKMPIKK